MQHLLCTTVDNILSCDSHSGTGAHPFTHRVYQRFLGHILLQRMREKSVRYTETIPPYAGEVSGDPLLWCIAPLCTAERKPVPPFYHNRVFLSHGHQVISNANLSRKQRKVEREVNHSHNLLALKSTNQY